MIDAPVENAYPKARAPGRQGPYLGDMWRQLPLPLGLLFGISASAQCGACLVGDTCMVDPPLPSVCPLMPPSGQVGVPYTLDVTFWIPPSFPEPNTQLNVVLSEVVLEAIENIPLGLTYEASSPDLTYHPQQNPFGCVRVCGMPIVAGPDTLRIHVTATGTVGGITTNRPYTFSLPITVLPAAPDSLPPFSYEPDSLCAPAEVLFSAVGADALGLTAEWSWDFGNGSSFSGSLPPAQLYADAGTYPVTLARAYSAAAVAQVNISSVNGSWCGDLDEPDLPVVGCLGQPDLYFTVTDARLGQERSATISNSQSGSWSSPGIALGFPPFTLRLFDADALSDDDELLQFPFAGDVGTYPFSINGTTGSVVVSDQLWATLEHTDTIVVRPTPTLEFAFDPENAQLCVEDDSLNTYTWFLDGSAQADDSTACVAAQNGLWTVTAVNSYGCASAASFLVTGLGVPELAHGGNDPTIRVVPGLGLGIRQGLIAGTASIAWFDMRGSLVGATTAPLTPGAESFVDIPALAPGCYGLRATTDRAAVAGAFIIGP